MPSVFVSNINTGPGETPFLIAPSLPAYVAPVWTVGVGAWRSGPEFELPSISNRSLTVKLDSPSTFSFSVMGDAPDAYYVNELISDVWVTRNGLTLYRGRVLGSDDNVDATSYGINFRSEDYRSLLDRRVLVTWDNNLTLPSVTISEGFATWVSTPTAPIFPNDVVWNLIQLAESQPGMALGITKGLWEVVALPPVPLAAEGVTPWRYADGDVIGTIIRGISQMEPGFDFWIGSDLKANIQQERGLSRGASLDYGGVVTRVSRAFEHDTYANFIRQSGQLPSQPYSFPRAGDAAYAPQYAKLIDPAQTPEGGWATPLSDTSLLSPDQVQRAGKANYDKMTQLKPTYNVTLLKGAWGGPDHIWVGDTVRLAVKRGRLEVNELMRVFSININIDANDSESVSMTLNWPDDPAADLKKFAANLWYLSKR